MYKLLSSVNATEAWSKSYSSSETKGHEEKQLEGFFSSENMDYNSLTKIVYNISWPQREVLISMRHKHLDSVHIELKT